MSDAPNNTNKPMSRRDPADPDTSQLLHQRGRNGAGRAVHTITVKPRDQLRVPLGNYTDAKLAKGFSIEFDPEPDPQDSVVAHITSLGTVKQYRLVLHVANFGDTPVTAIVTEL